MTDEKETLQTAINQKVNEIKDLKKRQNILSKIIKMKQTAYDELDDKYLIEEYNLEESIKDLDKNHERLNNDVNEFNATVKELEKQLGEL